jgi:hypothetical protein
MQLAFINQLALLRTQGRSTLALGVSTLAMMLLTPTKTLQAQPLPIQPPPQIQPVPSSQPEAPTQQKKGLECGLVTIAGFAHLPTDEAMQKTGVKDTTLSVAEFSKLMKQMGFSDNPVTEDSRQKAYEYMAQKHGEYALGWESTISGEGHALTVTSNSDGLSFRDCNLSFTKPPVQGNYQFYVWSVKQ